MSHNTHFSIAASFVLAACAADPSERTNDNEGGKAGSGGDVGGAGGDTGGTTSTGGTTTSEGGTTGSGGDTSTGGTTSAGGEGGQGGNVPVFNCDKNPAKRFVMLVEAEYEPSHIAVDGGVYCQQGGCFPVAWAALHIGEPKNKMTTLDVGEVAPGTKLETNWGQSADGTLKKGAPNYTPNPVPESETDSYEHAVDLGTTYCYQGVCSYAKFKCCYGDKEVPVGGSGANLTCVASQ